LVFTNRVNSIDMRVDTDVTSVRISCDGNQILIEKLDDFEILLDVVLILVG